MIQSFMRTVRAGRKQVLAFLLASCIGVAVLAPCTSTAQNLGTTPAVGQAVQGQTAAQPEGAFLNAVNWLCNVICPVGAGIAVVATILQWRSGRSWLPSAMTAGGLICVRARRRDPARLRAQRVEAFRRRSAYHAILGR